MRSPRNVLFGLAISILLALSASTLTAGVDEEVCVQSGSICKNRGCKGVCGRQEAESEIAGFLDDCWCLF